MRFHVSFDIDLPEDRVQEIVRDYGNAPKAIGEFIADSIQWAGGSSDPDSAFFSSLPKPKNMDCRQGVMNLYLIKTTVKVDYDEVREEVIAALTEKRAIDQYSGDREHVSVKVVGKAAKGVAEGRIICDALEG